MKQKLSLIDVIREVVIISLPAMFNQLIMTLEMTFVILMASAIYSEREVAALGGAVYIFWLDFSVVYFVMVGISSVVARARGEENWKLISRVTGNGALLAIVTQLILSLTYLFLLRERLLRLLGFSPELMPDVHAILTSFLIIFPVRVISWAISSSLMGLGRTDKMTAVTLSYLVPEISLLWYAFSRRYELSIALGVAFAIGALVSLASSYYLLRGEGVKPRVKSVSLLRDWLELARIGVPSSISSILFSLVYILMLPVITSFGKSVLAALTLAQRIESLLWMVAWGLYSATVAIVGRLIGARHKEEIPIYLRTILWGGFILNMLLAWFLIVNGKKLLSLVSPSASVIEHAYAYLFYTALASYFMVLEGVFSAVLVAIGNTVPLMIVDTLFNFSRLPLLALLTPHLGPDGIWIAINLSNVLKGVSLGLVANYLLWKGEES